MPSVAGLSSAELRILVPWNRLQAVIVQAQLPSGMKSTIAACSDGIDNDGDGLVDQVLRRPLMHLWGGNSEGYCILRATGSGCYVHHLITLAVACPAPSLTLVTVHARSIRAAGIFQMTAKAA